MKLISKRTNFNFFQMRPPQPHHNQGQGPFYQYPHPPAAIIASPPYFFPQQGKYFIGF